MKRILINAAHGTNEWFVITIVLSLITTPIALLLHRRTIIDILEVHSWQELGLIIIALIIVWFFIYIIEVCWQLIKSIH